MSKKSDGSIVVDVEAQTAQFKKELNSLKSISIKAFAAISAAAGGAALYVGKAGIEFESAFAGVRKTVDATEEELKLFEKGLLNLSTKMPQTAAQLAGIAEAAGQLGIKNKHLMQFTETMAQLGDATNMASEEAATSLARFANVTGMSQDNFDRLGSSVVALGNNMATTESEIVDMALNIAGAATQVGMSENQIMAFSAALSSVGIEAAAGGTAISTLLIDMKKATLQGGDDLKKFADAANVTSEQFKKAFEEDATNAVSMFVRGLATAELRGKDAFKILEEVGINETRMTKAMLNLSGASSVLTDAIAISSGAWEENTALMKEAEQRYQTTESKLKILQNGIKQTGITIFEKFKTPFKDALDAGIIGLNDLNHELEKGKLGKEVDILTQSFSELSKNLLEVGIKAIPKFINLITWFIKNGKLITTTIAAVASGFAAFKTASKAVNAIDSVSSAWKVATNVLKDHAKTGQLMTVALANGLTKSQFAVGVLTGKIKLLTAAQIACKAASPVAWITVLATVIGAVAVGFALSSKKTDEFTQKLKKNSDALKEAKKRADDLKEAADAQYEAQSKEVDEAKKYAKALSKLIDENGKLTGSKEEAIAKIEKLNEALGINKYYYDESTKTIRDADGAVKDLTKSVEDLIVAQKGQIWLDANKDTYAEALKERQELTNRNLELFKEYKKAVDAVNGSEQERLRLEQEFASGKVGLDEYIGESSMWAEKVEQRKVKLSELTQAINVNSEALKENEKNISVFERLTEAISNSDTKAINSILTLGTNLSTLTDSTKDVAELATEIQNFTETMKTMEQYESEVEPISQDVKDKTVSRIEEMKAKFEELTGINWEQSAFATGGKAAIDKYLQDAEEAKSKINDKMTEIGTEAAESMQTSMNKSFTEDEKLKDGLKTNVTNALDSLNEPIKDEATKNADSFNNKWNDSVNTEMPSSTLKAFEKTRLDLNNAINSFTPNPIVIPVIAQAKSNLSRYGLSIGGATYDGTTGGSFINEKYSDIVSSSKKVIQKMQSKIGRTVLQAKESKSDSTSKNVSVNQVNNFNVEVDKPSKISRDFEQTTKKLASSL